LKFYIPKNNYAEEKKADLGLKAISSFLYLGVLKDVKHGHCRELYLRNEASYRMHIAQLELKFIKFCQSKSNSRH
jgi:hypothetical protein